jgi:hypothetical protein
MSPYPDIKSFDLLSPDFLQDPYPFYQLLRREHPLYWHESKQSLGLWMATRYKDVRAFLRDPRLSSGGGRGSTTLRAIPPEDRKIHADFLDFYNKWVLLTDPPEHTRLRKLTNKGFAPSHVERLEPFMKGLAEGLLNALPAGESVDFMSRFAPIMPAMVSLEILGIPQKDREQLVAWSNDVAVLIGLGQITLDILKRVRQSYMDMTEYFTRHIDVLRANPMENVLSTLTRAVEEGDRLSTAELYAQAVVLMIGGHETTRNLIGSGLYLLLKHPEQFEQLRREPDLIGNAIEEFLRFESPVQFVGRSAKEDIEHHGKTIHEGQMIMLMIGAANRDPDIFPDPDRLDITRTPNKHLSFGLGAHYCLGAPLARVQTRIVFDALLRRFSRIKLLEEPQWAPSPVFRGPVQLIVELET